MRRLLVKVCLVGDCQVGKTTLFSQCQDNPPPSQYEPTVGLGFKVFHSVLDDYELILHVWDVSGDQRFKHIRRGSFRGGYCGVILMYSTTDRSGFAQIRQWKEEVTEGNPYSVTFLLVGNCGRDTREVTYEEGIALGEELGVPFIEISAMNRWEVKQAIDLIVLLTVVKSLERENKQ